MNCYVTKEMTAAALENMQKFYVDLASLYNQYGINVEADLGRRNMLMSSLQEKMFAEQIKLTYPSAYSDGKTGEPDIVIPEISSELECKLTSKRKAGSWQLQTDYNTLKTKGSLDYLYVLSSNDFSEFAVLFFEGLSIDDFYPPASGSRGKSRMRLSTALKKCTVLCGDYTDKSLAYLAAATKILDNRSSSNYELKKASSRIKHWTNTSKISFALESV